VTSDKTVSFQARLSTSRHVRVQQAFINIRDEQDRAFPTGTLRNVTLGPRGVRLTGRITLPPGTYRYRVGYLTENGTWVNVGTIRTLRVTAPSPAPTPTPSPAPASERWVMGYYVGYLKDDYPLDAVEWDAMTHVAVGAAVPKNDGSLDSSFYLGDNRAGHAWAKSVVDRAHQNGTKAVLMLGGAESRTAFASAASAKNRRAFVDNIISLVDTLGFDGVDIDWEPMVAADGPDAIALGRELKARRPGLQLTIPVGPVNRNLPQNTIFPFTAELASVYDQINIMSYGMNGGWENWSSWHSSAMFGEFTSAPMSVDGSVKAYLAAGVPKKKLGIGIGFFGSCMTGVVQPRQMNPGMKVVADDNVMSYKNIMNSYHQPDLARWDDISKVPYLSSAKPIGPAGCNYVTYEDARSIAEKAKYVDSLGLGGAIIWNINEGHIPTSSRQQGSGTLMSAVRSGFLD